VIKKIKADKSKRELVVFGLVGWLNRLRKKWRYKQNVPQGLKRVLNKSPRGEKTYLSG